MNMSKMLAAALVFAGMISAVADARILDPKIVGQEVYLERPHYDQTVGKVQVAIGNEAAKDYTGEVLPLRVGKDLKVMFDVASGPGFSWYLSQEAGLEGLTFVGVEDKKISTESTAIGGVDKVRIFTFKPKRGTGGLSYELTFEKKRGETGEAVDRATVSYKVLRGSR